MATRLGTFVAGAYKINIGGVYAGIYEPDGISMRFTAHGEQIQSGELGLSFIDGVQRGKDLVWSWRALEQLEQIIPLFCGDGSATTFLSMGSLQDVGHLYSDLAFLMSMSAVAGTRAATDGPATINTDVFPTASSRETMMGPLLRRFPVEVHSLPQGEPPILFSVA